MLLNNEQGVYTQARKPRYSRSTLKKRDRHLQHPSQFMIILPYLSRRQITSTFETSSLNSLRNNAIGKKDTEILRTTGVLPHQNGAFSVLVYKPFEQRS
jgi:hypothetical protein